MAYLLQLWQLITVLRHCIVTYSTFFIFFYKTVGHWQKRSFYVGSFILVVKTVLVRWDRLLCTENNDVIWWVLQNLLGIFILSNCLKAAVLKLSLLSSPYSQADVNCHPLRRGVALESLSCVEPGVLWSCRGVSLCWICEILQLSGSP